MRGGPRRLRAGGAAAAGRRVRGRHRQHQLGRLRCPLRLAPGLRLARHDGSRPALFNIPRGGRRAGPGQQQQQPGQQQLCAKAYDVRSFHPGQVHDPKRATHRALGLRSSVYASLVMPFRRHLKTFGTRAVREALRVSLVNATAGHGSSWQ